LNNIFSPQPKSYHKRFAPQRTALKEKEKKRKLALERVVRGTSA